MATSYRDTLLEMAPPWLRTPLGETWLRGIGDLKDALLERLKQSVFARFPSTAAPGQALDLVGADRKLPRSPAEADATYATRLRAAWDTWYWGGTAYGVLLALDKAGYTNARIHIGKAMRYELDVNKALTWTALPTNSVAWTGNIPSSYWSNFDVIFGVTGAIPFAFSGGNFTDINDLESIRDIVRLWKPAQAFGDRVIVYVTGTAWGLPIATLFDQVGLTWSSTPPEIYLFDLES